MFDLKRLVSSTVCFLYGVSDPVVVLIHYPNLLKTFFVVFKFKSIKGIKIAFVSISSVFQCGHFLII